MFFTLHSSQAIAQQNQTQGTLNFATGQGPVIVSVATSFISQEQSDLNLEQEVGSRSFQNIMDAGRATWSQQLGRVKIDAIDGRQLAVFYTNLWKSMLFPRYLQEIDAQGLEVHMSPYTGKISPGKLVADSGFWDSYRTVYHLQSMVFPDNLGSTIDGFVNAYTEAKWLPQWASPGNRASMVGTMGDVVLADAIAKSKWGFLKGFDVEQAYAAIRHDALDEPERDQKNNMDLGRIGLDDYTNLGYVPYVNRNRKIDQDAVARTLNYYMSDSAISLAAGYLGKHVEEKVLAARSQRYSTLFNADTGYFEPKDFNGVFKESFSPIEWGTGFTEASAVQYRFYLPFDVEGLSKLYNGTLCEVIQNMFLDQDQGTTGSYNEYIHEMREAQAVQSEFGQYAHGNQPVHHVLYVAKKAGCNNIADKYLRMVMKDLYTTRGWAGDEDNGEMSSWYVLSALGIYALQGAKDEIVLGSPAVKNATMQLPNNKALEITTENQAADNFYVQAVTWTRDNEPPCIIDNNVIQFTQLMRGGKLHFEMGPEAKPSATAAAADAAEAEKEAEMKPAFLSKKDL